MDKISYAMRREKWKSVIQGCCEKRVKLLTLLIVNICVL